MLIAHVVLIRNGTDAHHWSVNFSDASMDFSQNWKRREPDTPAKPLITRLLLFGIIALRIFYYSEIYS